MSIFRLILNFISIYFYYIIKKIIYKKIIKLNIVHDTFHWGLRSIQAVIVSIIFFKKVIILKFCLKLGRVFTNQANFHTI